MCFLLSMKLDLVNPSGLNVNLTKQVLLCQKRCEVPRVFIYINMYMCACAQMSQEMV